MNDEKEREHVKMLRQCAGAPGTPWYATIRFALDCIRDRGLAHKQGYEEGYAAGRQQAAEAAKLAGYEEGLKAGREPLIAAASQVLAEMTSYGEPSEEAVDKLAELLP